MITVRITEARRGDAARAVGHYLPWTWVAYEGGELLATGRDRLTEAETRADVLALFRGADVVVVQDGAPDWPLRQAVTA